MDYFVVFLDPESLIYYRMYLLNPTFIRIEPVTDEIVKKRDAMTIKSIKKLLDLKDFYWDFREADYYRRRQFPISFLQNECSPYPCYVFDSPLSKAFNSEKYIKAHVDITKFVPNAADKIKIKEELVTSTSEFI